MVFLWFSGGNDHVPPRNAKAKVHSVGLPGAPKPHGLKGLKGRPRRELRLGAPVYGWRLAIAMVDFPIQKGDFPSFLVCLWLKIELELPLGYLT